MNKRLEELEKTIRDFILAFRERTAARRLLNIPRVFSHVNDDTDLDDAPEAFVGARLRPRPPLGGSAIALPEPDEDAMVCAVGSHRSHGSHRT